MEEVIQMKAVRHKEKLEARSGYNQSLLSLLGGK